MSVLTPHQTDLTTFCKFKRKHKLRRALHLSLNRQDMRSATAKSLCDDFLNHAAGDIRQPEISARIAIR